MKTKNILAVLAIIVLLGANLIRNCSHPISKSEPTSEATLSDTIFLSQWRKEKTEKLKLIDEYSFKLQVLAEKRDSLNFSLALSKDLLKAYRHKWEDLGIELRKKVEQPDTNPTSSDKLTPLMDSIFLYKHKGDSACDANINALQNGISNRDSTIKVYSLIEREWQDIQREQDLQNQVLSSQLETSLKQQRKKNRQNKILSGGLLILSGITTAILFTRNK